jgi:drug/metabolite transporter (DMT)-like permease
VHIGVSGLLVHAVVPGWRVHRDQAGAAGWCITALVVGMQPLLTRCRRRLAARRARRRPRQWLGLALGLAGVALVVSGKFGDTAALGPMLVPALCALLGITVGTLYQKRFCARFDLRTGSVIQFVPTALAPCR